MKNLEMVVFDMAGTTVRDKNEVENCFWEAAEESGIQTSRERIISMMGWSKRFVFETLWKEQLSKVKDDAIQKQIDQSYQLFTGILENHYQTQEVLPTAGCLELFQYLKDKNIKIALTTGFYRKVTDIILSRLGWNNLNKDYANSFVIHASLTSDEVSSGRPAPYMIFKAMELCDVRDVRKVIKIGDTPSDLEEGKNAGCRSFGILNGTHTREQLCRYENDGLMDNLTMFKNYIEQLN
jgi:phosphonatase-like hydrolase